MRNTMIGVISGVAAAAVVVIVVAVSLIDLGESAGAEEGITLRQVAGDPAAYAGQQVTVSGEIAENDYFSPADARVVFAIGDDADGRLLVYPRPAADVPALDESTVVRVRGTVEVAEPQATSPDGFVHRGGLLAASGATAVVLAEQVEIVARNPNEPPPAESVATTTTISRLLAEPGDFSDGPVKIPGRVSALLQSGFVLAADGGRIFVGAPSSSRGGIERGDRVMVRADIARLSRFRAHAVQEALASKPRAVEFEPSAGDTFLLLRRVERRP